MAGLAALRHDIPRLRSGDFLVGGSRRPELRMPREPFSVRENASDAELQTRVFGDAGGLWSVVMLKNLVEACANINGQARRTQLKVRQRGTALH